MRLLALACITGTLTVPTSKGPMGQDPCPEGRTLERRLENADAVVMGEVTLDRDCRPPRVDPIDSGLVADCIGRRADLGILRSWKGSLSAGDGLALVMPAPGDSAGLLMRKGETHIVFARLSPAFSETQWWGETEACLFPEGSTSSDSVLVKQLDTWQRTHKTGRSRSKARGETS